MHWENLIVCYWSDVTGVFELQIHIVTKPVVWWLEFLTTDHDVSGSIPGSAMGIFLQGHDSHGDQGLGSLVELRFKGPPPKWYFMLIYHHSPHWDNVTAPHGVPTSEVGYTSAITGWGDYEVHKGHVVGGGGKAKVQPCNVRVTEHSYIRCMNLTSGLL
jgi:hypothetical protein